MYQHVFLHLLLICTVADTLPVQNDPKAKFPALMSNACAFMFPCVFAYVYLAVVTSRHLCYVTCKVG